MKERPILMSAPMVRACLSDQKTQTRRIVKSPPRSYAADDLVTVDDNGVARIPYYDAETNPPTHDWMVVPCRYGKPGDRLWVRETWADEADATGCPDDRGATLFRATDPGWDDNDTGLKWRPSIFMPRARSRLTLEVTGIRVERLQDISYEDALAEGVADFTKLLEDERGYTETPEQCARRLRWPQREYEKLWKTINGAGSWAVNPWVWVVSFRMVKAS